MKIIIATGIFLPDIGGPATYVERLAHELKKRQIDFEIITYADECHPERSEGSRRKQLGQSSTGSFGLRPQDDIRITRVPRNYALPMRYFLYCWHLLFLAKDAQVIYAQCPVGSGLPSCLVSKILGRKFVLKITGDYAWEQGRARFGVTDSLDIFQAKKYSWSVELLRKIEKWVAQGTDKIITPSQYLKKVVQKWGIKEDKINVIYNTIEDLPALEISQEQAQEKIGLSGNILLSVGRLVPWKGFGTLIEMMPDLLKKNPNFRLIIIGDGPERKKLKLQVTSYKLKDKVFLISQVPRDELAFYFKASDLFILNTDYEGLPHIILEAMQRKIPVITTKVGGNPEVIQDDYNGILVEYNNQEQLKEAILRLWADKNCQQKFIENSLKELEKFDLDKMIDQTLKVLTK